MEESSPTFSPRYTDPTVSRATFKTVLSLCLPSLVLVAACGTSPAAQGGGRTGAETTGPVTASSTVPGVFFPVRQPSVDAYMMAFIRGELVLDGAGCLRLGGEGGSLVPVWPPGFGLEASGEEVRILNGKGQVVARVGDRVVMGGGEAPLAERLPGVDEWTKRELQERCPGQYWLAAPDVDVVRQG